MFDDLITYKIKVPIFVEKQLITNAVAYDTYGIYDY